MLFNIIKTKPISKKRALIGTASEHALSNKKKIFDFISYNESKPLEMRKATARKKTCVVKLLYL